ncbi:DUF397 domain-containing protein [Streptomyces sp. NPDC001667]
MTTDTRPTALEVAAETFWFKSSYSGDNGGGGCVSIAILTGRVGIRDSKQVNGPAFIVPTAAWTSFVNGIHSGRLTSTMPHKQSDAWFKSSHSGDTGGMSCVEVTDLITHIAIRDSKQKDGPTTTVPADAWTTFIRAIQADRPGPH